MSWFKRQCLSIGMPNDMESNNSKPQNVQINNNNNNINNNSDSYDIDNKNDNNIVIISQEEEEEKIRPKHNRNTSRTKSRDDLSLLAPNNSLRMSGSRRSSIAVSPRKPSNIKPANSSKSEVDLSIQALENIIEKCKENKNGISMKSLSDQLLNIVLLLRKYKADVSSLSLSDDPHLRFRKLVSDVLNTDDVVDEDVRKFIKTRAFALEFDDILAKRSSETAMDFFTKSNFNRSSTVMASGHIVDLNELSQSRRRRESLNHNFSSPLVSIPNSNNNNNNNKNKKNKLDANAIKQLLSNTDKLLNSEAVKTQLASIDDWNLFNIFSFQQLVQPRSLFTMMTFLFGDLGLFDKFNIKLTAFAKFFHNIETSYLANPYHNSLHAADVVQNMYSIIKTDTFSRIISPLDVFIGLTAAAVHDVGHPGTTNQFQIVTNSELAERYNDKSVLENHHLSITFSLLKQSDFDIFSGINKESRRKVRQTIISMVLATDMQEHLNVMSHMEHLLQQKNEEVVAGDQLKYLCSALHCADVANPAKPLDIYQEWVKRIVEEWYLQGDMERKLGLEVSPLMNRHKPGVAKSQVGFIKFFIKPLFDLWAQLIPECDELNRNIEANLQYYLTEATPNPTPAGSRRGSESVQAVDTN